MILDEPLVSSAASDALILADGHIADHCSSVCEAMARAAFRR